ncbi:hypothetical protein BC833DRAFT_595338 [Globomyces pollinis-pini]|nr:hypothetical protein BC833DRAFT_595338 [Globomyces pollinis-pini]
MVDAKIEFLGPSHSILDRTCHYFKDLGKVISTGEIALSYKLLNVKSKCIACIPDLANVETLSTLKALGVEIIQTHSNVPINSPDSFLSVAKRVHEHTPNSTLLIKPFPSAAYDSLFAEIKGSDVGFDNLLYYVESNDDLQPLLESFTKSGLTCTLICVSIVPFEGNPIEIQTPGNVTLIKIDERDAIKAARKAIREYGLMCGVSSGALYHASMKLQGKTVCVFGDAATSYHKTLLNDDWLSENGMSDQPIENLSEKYRGASVDDLQLPEATCIFQTASVNDAIDLMVSRDFSQLPVTNAKRKIVGLISIATLQDPLRKEVLSTDPVGKWMYRFPKSSHYKIVTPNTPLEDLEPMFENTRAVFVTDESGKFPLAVVTKVDVLRFLGKRG